MQLAGMKPPKARGAMRPGESGLLAGGMLLAKLLGADTGGVAQFAQGYTGARQQSADLDNANAAQQYASERENLLMQAQLEMEKAQRITAKAGEIRAQMFDIKKEKAASDARIQNFIEKQAMQQMADDADLQKAALDASTKKGISAKQYEYYLTLTAGKNLTPERAQMIATAVEDFKNEQAWEAQKPDIKWAQTVLANPRSDTRDKILAAKKIARVEQNPVFASRFNPSGDPEFQSMWADPEIQKALAEASTYEKRMMSLDKKDQALIENLTARTKLTMEQATQLAGMFELNKQAKVAGIELTNAKIAEAYARANDLKNNPGGPTGRNDVAYAKLYLDLADGVRKRADSLAELYKYDDMPENAKEELSNLEAEYKRLRSEAELFVPGGAKSSVTSTGQPKSAPATANETPTQRLNRLRQEALDAGKPKAAVEAVYQRELKKLNAGK